MSMRSYFFCLVTYFIFSSFVWAGEVQLDWNRIFSGDVIVEAVDSKDGLPGVRASFCVKAERERIWSALTDYNSFPTIYRGVNKIQVLESDAFGAKVEFWYTVKFLKIFTKDLHYILNRRYPIPGRQITWTRLSGDLKRIEGSWEIRDTGKAGIYLLVYSSYVEPDGFVPTTFVRNGAMSEAADMAQRIRTWIDK